MVSVSQYLLHSSRTDPRPCHICQVLSSLVQVSLCQTLQNAVRTARQLFDFCQSAQSLEVAFLYQTLQHLLEENPPGQIWVALSSHPLSRLQFLVLASLQRPVRLQDVSSFHPCCLLAGWQTLELAFLSASHPHRQEISPRQR